MWTTIHYEVHGVKWGTVKTVTNQNGNKTGMVKMASSQDGDKTKQRQVKTATETLCG